MTMYQRFGKKQAIASNLQMSVRLRNAALDDARALAERARMRYEEARSLQARANRLQKRLEQLNLEDCFTERN